MKKRWFTLAAVMAALVLILAACQSATPEPTEVPPTEAPTEAPTEEMEEPTAEEEMITPSVSVEDQTIKDGQITVPSATSDGPGWMVIHADDGGAPGAVVGQTALSDGENTDIVVDIDTDMATPTLYAMLHTDSGEVGTYEFPDADPPVKVEGSVVVKPFKAESGKMAMGATVAVSENEVYGQYLVDSEGMSLYLFTNDTEDTSNCYDDCATAWPPLLTEGDPVAGEGVDESLLGTTERDDGSMQVTYNGWPLYYFAQDQAAGDTEGQGVGDVWYLLTPAGEGIGMESMEEESMGATLEIDAVDSAFEPREAEVSVGTTVVWTNVGAIAHTVTADDGSFDSGNMDSGDTFEYTFEEPGTYPYYCVYHGDTGGVGMAGVITVTDN